MREMKPIPVSDLELSFPATVMHLMPKMGEIPEEFTTRENKWVAFQARWFFQGLKGFKAVPKEGIDTTLAIRHLSCIQASFEPKHEHKRAAVAWLASLWFEDVQYEKETPPCPK